MNVFQKKTNGDQIVNRSYLNPFVQNGEYHPVFSKIANHLVTHVKDSKAQYRVMELIYSFSYWLT